MSFSSTCPAVQLNTDFGSSLFASRSTPSECHLLAFDVCHEETRGEHLVCVPQANYQPVRRSLRHLHVIPVYSLLDLVPSRAKPPPMYRSMTCSNFAPRNVSLANIKKSFRSKQPWKHWTQSPPSPSPSTTSVPALSGG